MEDRSEDVLHALCPRELTPADVGAASSCCPDVPLVPSGNMKNEAVLDVDTTRVAPKKVVLKQYDGAVGHPRCPTHTRSIS